MTSVVGWYGPMKRLLKAVLIAGVLLFAVEYLAFYLIDVTSLRRDFSNFINRQTPVNVTIDRLNISVWRGFRVHLEDFRVVQTGSKFSGLELLTADRALLHLDPVALLQGRWTGTLEVIQPTIRFGYDAEASNLDYFTGPRSNQELHQEGTSGQPYSKLQLQSIHLTAADVALIELSGDQMMQTKLLDDLDIDLEAAQKNSASTAAMTFHGLLGSSVHIRQSSLSATRGSRSRPAYSLQACNLQGEFIPNSATLFSLLGTVGLKPAEWDKLKQASRSSKIPINFISEGDYPANQVKRAVNLKLSMQPAGLHIATTPRSDLP